MKNTMIGHRVCFQSTGCVTKHILCGINRDKNSGIIIWIFHWNKMWEDKSFEMLSEYQQKKCVTMHLILFSIHDLSNKVKHFPFNVIDMK